MKPITLLTMPHTGARAVLFSHLFENYHPQGVEEEVEDNSRRFLHFNTKFEHHYERLIRDTTVVCTLRHPLKVAASWERRGISQFDGGWHYFNHCLDAMSKIKDEPNVVFIPVDCVDIRFDNLKTIDSRVIDLWPYVGDYDESMKDVELAESNTAVTLAIENNVDLLRRFYNV